MHKGEIMFHKKFITVILGLIAVLTMSISAMAQDEEAGVLILADGDEVEGVISADVQTVAYMFNGNEGDEVTITMETDHEELDTFLVLLTSDGVLVASNDDADSTSVSQIETELPQTGSYMILASSYEFIDLVLEFEGEDEMDFVLSIEGNTPVEELADGFELSFETMEDGDSFEGELDEDVQAYYYVFAGSEGDVVNIIMTTDAFPSMVQVFSPTGERIAATNRFENSDTSSFIEELELPADGSYLVVATDVFFYNANTEEETELVYTGGEFEIELSFE
jgi:hypothetical protein